MPNWLHKLPIVIFILGMILIGCLTQFCGWHGAEVIIAFTLVLIVTVGLGQMIGVGEDSIDDDDDPNGGG